MSRRFKLSSTAEMDGIEDDLGDSYRTGGDGIGLFVAVAVAALLDFLGHEITRTSRSEEDGFRF
jgi:hypothetical protein